MLLLRAHENTPETPAWGLYSLEKSKNAKKKWEQKRLWGTRGEAVTWSSCNYKTIQKMGTYFKRNMPFSWIKLFLGGCVYGFGKPEMPECISTVCFCVHVGCTLPQILPQEDEPLGESRRNSSMASCLCREVEILFLNLIDDFLSFSLFFQLWEL